VVGNYQGARAVVTLVRRFVLLRFVVRQVVQRLPVQRQRADQALIPLLKEIEFLMRPPSPDGLAARQVCASPGC
jgi:hypothetical protein